MDRFASPAAQPTPLPFAVLVVDDEPHACKWFARLFADEFTVLTASNVDEAMALLAARAEEVAVVLTDYRMPGRNGVELLSGLCTAYPHISRLLISAYADKEVAMAAINEGQVEHILEKPLNEPVTRRALRAAVANSRRRVEVRVQLDIRAVTLRETLGFLAHEASAPLATVRSYLSAMKDRQTQGTSGGDDNAPQDSQRKPGNLLSMIESAQRGADFAQSLIEKFVRSERDNPAIRSDPPPLLASELVAAVQAEYPFTGEESQWVRCIVSNDFELPSHRDLLYLVLCTLVKNAVLALRASPPNDPHLFIEVAHCAPAPGLPAQALIGLRDNGPGLSPDVLTQLTREPLNTRPPIAGNGMGLMFCHRVMSTLGGAMEVQSTLGEGAAVTLYFPIRTEESNQENP